MCNNNGLTAAQLARNQRFSECMRILEEVHQQQLSLKLHENGSNGHSFANGKHIFVLLIAAQNFS